LIIVDEFVGEHVLAPRGLFSPLLHCVQLERPVSLA